MYKYFEHAIRHQETFNISASDIRLYHAHLVATMKAQGASESDLALISDELIINSILNKINPEDAAWAILQ